MSMKRLIDEAKRIIRINSVTANGNEELANYMLALMQDRGLKTQMQHVMHSDDHLSKRQFNVIGIFGDPLVDRKIKKGLLLNTHLDTVSPGILENWTEMESNPFSAVIKDGKIFGLGSADVKLDFLCKLFALERFRDQKLKEPIYLVGTCAEEVGMLGVKYLIKSGALNPKYVLVGEPSELKVVYAHKCLNVYRVSVGYQSVEKDAQGYNRRIDLHSLGRSAHSSYPHLGENAISSAVEFLHRASEQGFSMRFTRLDGGDTINKVPDRALIQFYLSSHQFEDFKRYFKEVMRGKGNSTFKVELGGLGDAGVSFLPEQLFPCIAHVVEFFKALSTDLQLIKDDTYDPAFSTVNFGKIKQRAGSIEMHFDLRLLPEISPDEIQSKIEKGMQAIVARHPTLNITAIRERGNPALDVPMENPFLNICKDAMSAAGIDPQFTKKATSTEAAQYFQAGYPAVIFGPGKSQGNSHSPNEHNIVDHLEKAVEFYSGVIERVCCP